MSCSCIMLMDNGSPCDLCFRVILTDEIEVFALQWTGGSSPWGTDKLDFEDALFGWWNAEYDIVPAQVPMGQALLIHYLASLVEMDPGSFENAIYRTFTSNGSSAFKRMRHLLGKLSNRYVNRAATWKFIHAIPSDATPGLKISRALVLAESLLRDSNFMFTDKENA